jgi:hypothetical protein
MKYEKKVGNKNPQNRTKKSFSFRLSEQAVENLGYIQNKSGMSATAAVEYALALMKAIMG